MPNIVKQRLGMERLSVLRRWEPYISSFIFVSWFMYALWPLLDPETRKSDIRYEALFLSGHPALVAASWFVLKMAPGSVTRTRLVAWILVLGLMAVVAQFIMEQSFVPSIWAIIMAALVLETAHASAAIVALWAPMMAFGVYHGLGWGLLAVYSFLGLALPLLLSQGLTHILAIAVVQAISLASSQDAGEALFSLLLARYDAVLELNEDGEIVHASDTFFGIVSALPPTCATGLIRKLLWLRPIMEDSSSSGTPPPDTSGLIGQSFFEMLTSDADRNQLRGCIQEQMSQRHAQENGDWDIGLGGATAASSRQIATAVHVCMRTQSSTKVKLRLYCTACRDAMTSRSRFFVGVCMAESPSDAPHGPEACLVIDPPALSREWIKFDAMSPAKALTECAMVSGALLPAGTPLSRAFPESSSRRFDPFLDRMLSEARLGESRVFKTLKYSSASGGVVYKEVRMELSRDSREWEAPGNVEVLVTLVAHSGAAHRPRSNASSSSGASSLNGFTATLASIKRDGSDKSGSSSGPESVPSFDEEQVQVLEWAGEILAAMLAEQPDPQVDTALAAVEDERATAAAATASTSHAMMAPPAQLPEAPTASSMDLAEGSPTTLMPVSL